MTKTLNQIIFFPSKSEYIFQQHWESEYLKKKIKNITPPPPPPPPFKLNGRSLIRAWSIVTICRPFVDDKSIEHNDNILTLCG